jgi:hypothetical protein
MNKPIKTQEDYFNSTRPDFAHVISMLRQTSMYYIINKLSPRLKEQCLAAIKVLEHAEQCCKHGNRYWLECLSCHDEFDKLYAKERTENK